MHVALVTWSGLPDLSDDDQTLRDALVRRGARVEPAVWSDPAVNWKQFDAVVVRSTWDYHLRVDAFSEWIVRMDREAVRLWNPPAVLRANIHKSYLVDLARSGVRVVPTVMLDAADAASVARVIAEQHWPVAVVKPSVSATAHRTYVVRNGEVHDAIEGEVLVQPFVREVVEEGEWSLVFLANELSHAVVKRPRAGDFRVQNDFGGSSAAMEPPRALVEDARNVLRACGERLLYARVDGVLRDGHLLLMELELVEPALFLRTAPGAAERFADAVLATMR